MKKRIGILVAVALVFLTGIIGGGTLVHNHSSNSTGGLLPGGSVPWATPGTIGSTTPNTGAFTSVDTPLIGPNANVQFNLRQNGAIVWAIQGGGTFIPAADNTTSFGQPGSRIASIFTPIIDSGTGGSIFLRTGNGNNAFEIIQSGASAVNWWGVSGQATGITPFLSVRGEANVTGVIQGNRGTGTLKINDGITNATQFEYLSVPAATRWITSAASNGGNPALNTTAGSIDVQSVLTSSRACASGFTRIGPNVCWITAGGVPTATALTNGTCTTVAVPSGSAAKILVFNIRSFIFSNNAISLRTLQHQAWDTSGCATNQFYNGSHSVFESVAVANQIYSEQGFQYAAPVTSGNVFLRTLATTVGASSGTSFVVIGYYD